MRRRLLSLVLLAALLAHLGVAPRGALAQADPPERPRYTVTDLAPLAGDVSQAFGLNDEGQVVGLTKVNISTPEGNPYHAFIWASGVMTDLGTLGGWQSIAYDINNAGQVAGWSHTATGGGDDDVRAAGPAQIAAGNGAFLWQNGAMQPLGTLGGSDSQARAINGAGQLVGEAHTAQGWPHAARWAGGVLDLGTLGGTISAAVDINDAGQIVGSSRLAGNQVDHAFLWQNGSMQDLGTLAGDYSQALAINNAGQVVGITGVAGGWHAFLWDGTMQDLGSLGGIESRANDINDNGQVVGTSATISQMHYRAFLWENGQMKDLNTQIPADSGWVLLSAEGINRRGQIVGWGTHNGQTHAFLLKPLAYYWNNPAGGAWHTAANWDPQGVPGEEDTTIFALAGEYTVDASEPPAAAGLAANQLSADRLIVTATATVNFDHFDLDLTYDSPDEPSLEVNGGGTANVNSGAATFSHAVVGGEAPADPANPPTARLQVFNEGTSLTGSGRLTIGDAGVGDLFVANGAHLTSAEARLGGTYPGAAVVGGAGSLWQSGSIAVGYGVTGTLTIEHGGRVDSDTAVVGFGALGEDSHVVVQGAAGNQASLWTVERDLTVARGWIDVENGAQVVVNQNIRLDSGALNLYGHTAPAYLETLGDVIVGGAGGITVFGLYPTDTGASYIPDTAAEIGGDLVAGRNGQAVIIVAADPTSGVMASFDTTDPARGLCQFGDTHAAVASIAGLMYCRIVSIGSAVSSGGLGEVEVSGTLLARELVRVGQPGGGASARVDMRPGFLYGSRLVGLDGVYIGPTGTVSGTGIIEAGGIGLLVDGVLSPGIRVLPAVQVQSAQAPPVSPATLAVSGTLTMSPTARLALPVTGASPGLYGSLAVTGTAALDGVLALNFSQGFTPQPGDAFTFLSATEGISGAFDSVEINGLPPGFEYELAYVDGQVVLDALDDGTPGRHLSLPLVTR